MKIEGMAFGDLHKAKERLDESNYIGTFLHK